jgi:SAM-dependent methyltransferase
MRLAKAPLRALTLLGRGEVRLAGLADGLHRLTKISTELLEHVRGFGQQSTRSEARLNTLAREVQELRHELSARMLQNSLQLGQLAHAVRMHEPERPRTGRLAGRPIPLTMDPSAGELTWEDVGGGVTHPDPSGAEWQVLVSCPLCGCAERTLVLEWNKLLLLAKAPDRQSARYDYSVCHACGVTYAARRPIGRRFEFLLEHFGEVTGKASASGRIPNPLLNHYPLSDEDKAQLRRMAAHGVWVSEHAGLPTTEYIEGALKDRFENSVHVDLLGNLVKPNGARVLEVRPRAGTIAESLRRLYNADVMVMPMWESQGFVLELLYGFTSKGVIDYDHFTIPFEGPFDLIVCNHILTHAVRPADFLSEIHAHLKPGGYVYLYNEPDDRHVLTEGKSLIAHLNPLHLQAFDRYALIRALAANGFEVTFIKGRNANHMCLARSSGTAVTWDPISPGKLAQRIETYREARSRAILKLPESMRQRVAGEWSSAIEHGLAAGALDFDDKGQLRFAVD